MVFTIYVSKQGDNFNLNPVYFDVAEKIQVADLQNKYKIIKVSKDGKNYEPQPIFYNSAANLQFNSFQGSKSILLSRDGRTWEPQPIFNMPALNFIIEVVVGQTTDGIVPPTEGFIKQGGWGASNDANTWTPTNMKKPPNKFKIVDANGKNVATDFSTMENAQYYINYYRSHKFPPDPFVFSGNGGGIPGKNVYRTTGQIQPTKSSGFKIRHYASDKPDDTTIEFEAEKCRFEAYEATGYFTIGTPEHDDTLSLKKYGPTHSKKGEGQWYIGAIQFSDGLTSLGYEDGHPETEKEVVKGIEFGNITGGKEIGFKGVIWPLGDKGAHVEVYIDLMDGQGWRLGVQADNIGGKKFKKDDNQQVQFRIDAAPQLKARNVIVEEIAMPPQKIS